MKKLALILAFASIATGAEAADQVRLVLEPICNTRIL